MKALDLFCGAGGVAKGLQRAGFHVTGIDIRPQPRYCGDVFIQGEALAPPVRLEDFDFVWASPPPCQEHVAAFRSNNARKGYTLKEIHRDRIPETRKLLRDAGIPYCIENVPGAPLKRCLCLTGEMFGLNTYRRRYFETSFLILAPEPGPRFGPKSKPGSVSVVGRPGGTTRNYRRGADGKIEWGDRVPLGRLADWAAAMGIDWMQGRELANAIPPAYAEFIGRAALAQLQARAA